MNKLRSNIAIGLNRNNSNASSSKESNVKIQASKIENMMASCQQQQQQAAKKKRTAFENISNAANANINPTLINGKENNCADVAKKSRFANPSSFLPSFKKDSSSKKQSNEEALAKENLEALQKSMKCSEKQQASQSRIPTVKPVKIETEHELIKPNQVTGWENIDTETDEFNVNDYAVDIFTYYRQREDKFKVTDYLREQTYLSKHMRQLLIDWMVEVQQQLEFNHEVLYLSVKLLDIYLSTTKVQKERLQLLGGAAMFIACKFEERIPPVIDDFIYVSDNAYDRSELIQMEMDILKTVGFDLGAPLSYTFLRRYAKCLKADMKFLTLSRYILELALQDYSFAYLSDSHKACAALYLAMKMTASHEQHLEPSQRTQLAYNEWNATFIHYTDAFLKDFIDMVPAMNNLVKAAPSAKHKTIFRKYSHPVFYEVAKVSPLSDVEMELLMHKSKSALGSSK